MTNRYAVEVTQNFEQNLNSFEAFVIEAEAHAVFDALLDELADVVVPNLERFPQIGRSFLDRSVGSVETLNALEQLKKQLGADGEIREYVSSNHLILYAVLKQTVYLLSIRHQKQLSFDFESLWAAGK